MNFAKTAVVMMTLFACSCSFDRSSHPVIGAVVGKQLTTKRPTVLAWGYTLKGGPFLLDSSTRMLRLYDSAKYREHQDLIGPAELWLPSGTSVAIKKIYAFAGDSSTVLTAFGEIGEGDTARRFYFPMGSSGELEVAPWEPPLRPAHRSFDVMYERAE